MGRRERFIAPSDAELRRLEEAALAKLRLVERRQQLIEKALRGRRKEELVEILANLCSKNTHARWSIEAQLEMPKPLDILLHDLGEAIRLATQVDEQKNNYDFDYDSLAYMEVKRLMQMLVSSGAIAEAMEISLDFMDKATRQMEFSDEGMMFEKIEACLQPVLEALEEFDEKQRASWAFRMQVEDRVGSVCRETLQKWSSPRDRK